MARGVDAGPLVPDPDVPRFLERVELEWPIDGLEPLAFVLARLLEPLSLALERADRAAAAIHLDLRLVDRTRACARCCSCRPPCATPRCCGRSSSSISNRIRPRRRSTSSRSKSIRRRGACSSIRCSSVRGRRPKRSRRSRRGSGALVGESRVRAGGPARFPWAGCVRDAPVCADDRGGVAARAGLDGSARCRWPRAGRAAAIPSAHCHPGDRRSRPPGMCSSIGEGCPAATSSSARAPGERRAPGGKRGDGAVAPRWTATRRRAGRGIAMNGTSR